MISSVESSVNSLTSCTKKCIFSLSILLSSNETTLLLQIDRLPYSSCFLFTCSLLLMPSFSTFFTCIFVTEATDLIPEKNYELWCNLFHNLANLSFLYFNYIFFMLRFLVWWLSLTPLVTPLQIRRCSYPFILLACFFHQFSIFLTFPNKIVLFSPKFKNK